MHGLMNWSLKLPWRPFDITIRLHLLLVIFFASEMLRFVMRSFSATGLLFYLITYFGMFLAILFHEYGHCFAARSVGGSADEVTLWPLGGLAHCHAPNTSEAQMKVAVGGPMVSVVCGLVLGLILLITGSDLWVDWNAWYFVDDTAGFLISCVRHIFWLNMALLLFNMLPAFPMDAGRMLQCFLWPRMGFGPATLKAIYVSHVCSVGLVVVGLVSQNFIFLCIALFNFMTAQQTKMLLQEGMLVDESVFGYDFSGGYTTLESSSPQQKRKKPGIIQKWKAKRMEDKLRREKEDWESTQERVDDLLAKVSDQGLHSLSEEERTFLRKASKRYK